MSELRSIDPPGNIGALNALFSRVSRNSDRVIVPINNTAHDQIQTAPAFYCIHSLSGAGGTDFCKLAGLMPGIRFYGIQAPPKKMRDNCFGDSVQSIAEYYTTALVKFQPDGPFFLGGWSAGAIIGVEIAKNLRARGRDVGLLAAIDTAPENTGGGLRPWHPVYVLEVVRNLPGWTRHDGLTRKGALPLLTRRIINKATAYGKMALARLRGEKMLSAYAVEGFMDLSLYPTDQKNFMKRLYNSLIMYNLNEYKEELIVYESAIKPLFHLPQVGRIWQKIAPGCNIVGIDGTHLSILHEPYVRVLAEDLQKRIVEVARRPPI